MNNFFVLLVGIALLPANGHAQVTAKHVDDVPKAVEVQRFKSPMLLEFPLAANRDLWNVGDVRSKDYVEIRKFVCDGVSFTDFASNAQKGKDEDVTVTFKFMLYDEPGIDKRVDVLIDIFRDDKQLAESGVLKNIKLGEKKHLTREIEMHSKAGDLDQDSKPTVKLTTVVRDDP